MRKLNFTNFRPPASACLSALAGMAASLLLTQNTSAQSCSCAGGTLATGIQVSPTVAHVGDTVNISQIGVSVGQIGTTGGCLVTNGIAYIVYPNGNTSCAFNTVYPSCPTAGNGLNGVQIFENHFYVTNAPNSAAPCAGPDSVQCIPSVIGMAGCVPFTTAYVIQSADTNKQLLFTTPNPRPDGLSGGNGAFLLTAKPRTVQFGTACDAFRLDNGQPVGGNGPSLVNILTPSIAVSKQCVTNCAPYSSPYGQPISFMGWVTNTGDTTLTNIVVTDNPSATIITFASTTTAGHPYPGGNGGTLQPGDSVQYMGNYQPAANLCGPFQDTVTACGTDGFEVNSLSPGMTNFVAKTVCATNSATCLVCTSAGISVTKQCPTTNGVPGGQITFTGSVCNTGNVPLINVTVANSLPLVGGGNVVVSIPTLAPGQCQSFSGSEVVPSNVCSLTDTLTAAGTNQCTGLGVVNTASATCPVVNNPQLSMVKLCPATNGVPGGVIGFTGTITNTGNVSITNIVIVNNQPNPGTPVITIPRLDPGQGQGFSGTEPVPTNVCSITDILSASGTDVCGDLVSTTATNTCPVLTTPHLSMVKTCPATNGLPGGVIGFTGTITNTGNVSITNIVIVNDQPAPNTPVTIIPRLDPGQGAAFSGTEPVGTNVCSITDNLSASGRDVCNNLVSTTAAQTCPVLTTPKLAVTKLCPTTAPPLGGTMSYTGGVTNVGNVAITNIVLTDSIFGTNVSAPVPSTIARLEPGQSASFTGSYPVPGSLASCSILDTIGVTGTDVCGHLITTNATANCPVACAPAIQVYKQVVCYSNFCEPFDNNLSNQKFALAASFSNNCPAFCYRIIVTNSGNTTLSNVTVVDNKLDLSSCFPGPFTLPVGASTNCIITDVTHCANVTNTVTAQGVGQTTGGGTQTVTASDTNAVVIVPLNISCLATVSIDGGAHFFIPSVCATQTVGNSYIVCFGITNTGMYDLQNVTVSNATGSAACLAGTVNIPLLPVGTGVALCCTNTCTAPETVAQYIVSTAGEASQAQGPVCDHNSQGIKIIATNTSPCQVCVACSGLPKICVTKLIACFLGTNQIVAARPFEPLQPGENCGTFGKLAVGVSGDVQDPAFCYMITVTNCGQLTLTNVTVIDDQYGDLTGNFFTGGPGTLTPGAGASFTFKAELPPGPNGTINWVTNTVTATGIAGGIRTNAIDHAVAEIVPASLSCTKQYTVDGGPLTNNVTLVNDTTTHTIVWYLTVHNTGLADLQDIQVTDINGDLPCNVSFTIPSLAAGTSTDAMPICTNLTFICTNGVTNAVSLFADHFVYGTNTICAFDINGSNIVVRSQSPCEAIISCLQPNACRTTGGGRTEEVNTDGQTAVWPDNVRYVTYGGQVGAPTGNKICVVTPQFQAGNPCIHGRWTHVRHQQGGLRGNFHAEFYDTLDCSCLGVSTTTVITNVAGVDGNPAQSYPLAIYAPGTVVDGRCNPGDKVAGPEPRPAPANKIVFTGVGNWADPNGRREGRATLFRVDLEDRSEPGGSHPKGGTNPPDRYRIRIWVLSSAELQQLNSGSGSDPYLLNFRNAISACIGINVQDGASVPVGTAVFGVRAPDIDDGGEQDRGNHQIHPAIMFCDPNNPSGPGLPNH